MTLRVSSRPIRPRYESAPYRMHPGRREHVHGPLVPLTPAARDRDFVGLIGALFIVSLLLAAVYLGVA